MRITAIISLFFALGCSPAAPTFECGEMGTYCEVDGGEYLALVPKTWNGRDLLPTILHYHGYGGTAQLLAEGEFHTSMSAENVLAIYPNSIEGSWGFHSGPSDGARDELAFWDNIVADVKRRGMPLDPDRFVVSGFSIGASMAWEVGCNRGDQLSGIAPVSGAFWLPMPPECDNPPPMVRQEHGTNDTVFPMEGRPLGDSWRQGPVLDSVALFVEASDCQTEPAMEPVNGFECEVWAGCGGGGEARLCIHDGDHRVTKGWHARTVQWAFSE